MNKPLTKEERKCEKEIQEQRAMENDEQAYLWDISHCSVYDC